MQLYKEIEAKFAIPDRPAFEHLLKISELAGFTCGTASTHAVQDHYLDTPGHDILASGYVCRVREKKDSRELMLKSLGETGGTIKRRQEYQQVIDIQPSIEHYLDLANWPAGQLREMIQTTSKGEALKLLFSLQQNRTVRLIMHQERPLAELSLDHVHVEHEEAFFEAEIERMPAGTEVEFQQIIDAAVAAWKLAPSFLSKFERGLGWRPKNPQSSPTRLSNTELNNLRVIAAGPHQSQALIAYLLLQQEEGLSKKTIAIITGLSMQQVRYWSKAFQAKRLSIFGDIGSHPTGRTKRTRIRADDTMNRAGRKALRLHFQRMLDHELGTRLGKDIEELHDMRVATRRMRAAFRVFGAYFEPAAIQPFLKGLKRTGQALGPVRDLDVFEEKAQHYLASLPAEQANSLDSLLNEWLGQRKAARKRMLDYFDSKYYQRFVTQFGQFLENEELGTPAIDTDEPSLVKDIAPRQIDARYQTILDYQAKLANAPIEVLHALRIDFKHLRYTLEFFAPVLGSGAGRVIREVKTMQDHLGDLNDAEVAIELLQKLLESQPELGDGLRAYLHSREAEKEKLLVSFPAAWDHFNLPDLQQSLTLAVSSLQD